MIMGMKRIQGACKFMKVHATSGPRSNPSVSSVRRHRRKVEGDILQGELRKIKPPTFNGEHRKGEEVEAWLYEMKNISNFMIITSW
jgi:hypothetical protein